MESQKENWIMVEVPLDIEPTLILDSNRLNFMHAVESNSAMEDQHGAAAEPEGRKPRGRGRPRGSRGGKGRTTPSMDSESGLRGRGRGRGVGRGRGRGRGRGGGRGRGRGQLVLHGEDVENIVSDQLAEVGTPENVAEFENDKESLEIPNDEDLLSLPKKRKRKIVKALENLELYNEEESFEISKDKDWIPQPKKRKKAIVKPLEDVVEFYNEKGLLEISKDKDWPTQPKKRKKTIHGMNKNTIYLEMREGLEDARLQWIAEINIIKDWRACYQYSERSPKLRFKSDVSVYGPEINFSLFESFSIPLEDDIPSPGRFNSSDDFILHTGGYVWACDWCPERIGWDIWQTTGQCDKQFLAVAAHPHKTNGNLHSLPSEYHKVGEPLSGKALVQIWAFDSLPSKHSNTTVPSRSGKAIHKSNLRNSEEDLNEVQDMSSEATESDDDFSVHTTELVIVGQSSSNDGNHKPLNLPKMVLGLGHEGGVTWDLKWRPAAKGDMVENSNGREFMRLGFLALVLGDGSLQVFDVPFPSIINANPVVPNDTPLIVKIEPVFRCSELQNADYKSIPLTVEWSRGVHHDRILVGCHDGTVALWKFFSCANCEETRPLMVFTADPFPIRTVAWAQHDSCSEAEYIISTAGHNGSVRFWDLREPFRPLGEMRLTRGYVLDMNWLDELRCVLMALDDGTLRIVSLNCATVDTPATGKPFAGTQVQGGQSYVCSSFALWSVHMCPSTGMVAYCGSDGLVRQFLLTGKAVDKGSRYKTQHHLCGGFAFDKENQVVEIIKESSGSEKTPRGRKGYYGTSTGAKISSKSNSKGKGAKCAGSPCDDTDVLQIENSPAGKASASGELDGMTTHKQEFPPKIVSIKTVKWNCNKGTEGWLCYGGAAGIIRCCYISPVST